MYTLLNNSAYSTYSKYQQMNSNTDFIYLGILNISIGSFS